MKKYMGITDLLNQNGLAWDEISETVSTDVDCWEVYNKVPFYLISNVGRKYGSPPSFLLVITKEHSIVHSLFIKNDILQEHPDAISYGDMISACCLDMKMEITNVLRMGIIWDMHYPLREFEISYRRKMKTYVDNEKDKDYN
jgi:hypothetical protein